MKVVKSVVLYFIIIRYLMVIIVTSINSNQYLNN